jgi:sugar lactone lactonase YvrE
MMTQQRKYGVAAAVVAVLLSACGGGGGGAGGTQAGSAPVTVPTAQAPTIASQPAAQSVSAGASATFTVTASGTDLAYQWQRDGKDIAGATSASYTLDNVQGADTGAKFTVVVKNAGGSVTSAAAVLTVVPAAARGLAFVAGSLGGRGNLDGVDGRFALPVRSALSPDGVLYVADDATALSWDGTSRPTGDTVLRIVNVATGAIQTINTDPLRTVGMAFDKSGNLYEATWSAVYRTAPGGKRTLFAGSATERGHGDGAGSAARFNGITAVAADAQGNLYVADYDVLRRMAPDGSVVTVAGSAAPDGAGSSKDGTGTAASFAAISALAVDAAGNIQVIDKSSLRVVTPAGVVGTRTLKENDPFVAIVPGTSGIAADKAGNVYVTHTYYGCRIRKVAPDGTMTDLAGMQAGRGSSDGKGAAAGFCRTVPDFYITWQTSGTDLGNLVLDGAGNLIVADTTNQTIRRVTPAGDVTTVAGRAGSSLTNVDGTGAGAQFVLNTIDYRAASPAFAPRSAYTLAADATGNVYVGENDRIRKITPDGKVGTLPLQLTDAKYAVLYLGGLAFGGNAYVQNSTQPPSRINADGSLTALAGVDSLGSPENVATDAFGNLYVKSFSGNGVSTPVTATLRKFAPDGTASTLPDASAPLGFADADGNIWGVKADGTVTRLGQDGKVTVVRTVSASAGAVPLAIARDRAGNLYVAWHEKPNWYSVHKVTPAGVDSVIAGTPGAYGVRLGAPGSLGAIDALTVGMDGNVYVMSEDAVLRIGQ